MGRGELSLAAALNLADLLLQTPLQLLKAILSQAEQTDFPLGQSQSPTALLFLLLVDSVGLSFKEHKMSSISAGISTGSALVNTGDTTGTLLLKTNGTTTALTLGTDQSATFSGELVAESYNETYAAVTSSGAATTVNCETGNAFSHVLTETTTFTFSNPPASGTAYSFSIEIIQDSGGSGHVVNWPTTVDWPAATAPTISTTASSKDIFVFYTRDGGNNWYGFTAGLALG
jgi:hypothetical protein